MSDLSRRKMIQLGGGAVALGGSVALCGTPAGANPDPDRELLAMIEELNQIDVSWTDLHQPEMEDLAQAEWLREWQLMDRIVATPAQGLGGVAAKLHSVFESRAGRPGRHRTELIHAAIADLDRLAVRDL